MTDLIKTSEHLKPVFETQGPKSHFFGYYYNNPLDPKAEKLLAHRTDFDGRELQTGDCAEVGYYTLSDGLWHSVGVTEAFNWQDGAMLQWIPGKEGTEIVYNLLIDGVAHARRLNLQTGEERILEKPIYAVHPSGKWAIGANFSRLAVCRPSYGYHESAKNLAYWQGAVHPEDGLFKIDLTSGSASLLLATAEVADQDLGEGANPESMHYLQHPMWNPDGTRFLLLHRFRRPNGSFKTRLFTASSEGQDLYHFPDGILFSHATWRNDREFTIWSQPGSGVMGSYTKYREAGAKWLIPIRYLLRIGYRFFKSSKSLQYVHKNGYYQYKDQLTKKSPLAHGQLSMDGHPTWYNNGQSLLVDTYQDEKNYRHLFSYDYAKQNITQLGKFYSPFNNCGYRCDLHPRIDDKGKFICIDSAHSGQRQLYVFKNK